MVYLPLYSSAQPDSLYDLMSQSTLEMIHPLVSLATPLFILNHVKTLPFRSLFIVVYACIFLWFLTCGSSLSLHFRREKNRVWMGEAYWGRSQDLSFQLKFQWNMHFPSFLPPLSPLTSFFSSFFIFFRGICRGTGCYVTGCPCSKNGFKFHILLSLLFKCWDYKPYWCSVGDSPQGFLNTK